MTPLALLFLLAAPTAGPQLPSACVPIPPKTGGAGPAVHDAWLEQATEVLQREEYGFSALGSGVFSAPNRAQGLRVRVSAQGLALFLRSADADGEGAPWRLGLRTRSFGRTDGAIELGPADLDVRGARVELVHGPLLEWLENRPEGLEHGWTIAECPPGSKPLWIGLELDGLALRIGKSGRAGVLSSATGEAQLRYTELRAFDATGHELEARLLPAPDGFGILVEDAGASYPLSVAPRLSGPQWTAESDQESASFGTSVATAGDVNGDGYSDVLIGAPWFDNGQTDEGRAFVYHGSASGLATSPAWTAEGDQAEARFGIQAATAGDVNGDGYADVLVGADLFDNDQVYEGRVFVYHGSASGLAASPAWTSEGNQSLALFGLSVATAGDVNGDGYSDVIVGAPWFDEGELNSPPAEGRAFVYHGSASGLAASPAWIAQGDHAFAFLGQSVATAGDVNGDGYADVLVGVHQYSNGQTGEGGAFVYHGSPSGLAASPAWTAEGGQAHAHFGSSVASAGDVNGDGYADVLVGAHIHNTRRRPQASAGELGQVSGPQLAETDEGRAYVFHGSASGLAATPAWTAEGDPRGANLGQSVASAGDVNGDGYADVIVGACFYSNGQADEGRALVYLGSASGLAASPAWTRESDQALAYFGWSVATAGDVDGDGYADILVGAPGFDEGQPDEGRACLFHGSSSGL